MNISRILIEQATERPDQPAIVEATRDGSRTLTFGQIAERSARAAALLRAAGLRKGDRILVFQPMSIELYVALLGIFRLGLVATVLDPSAGRRHIEQCCSIARPKAFLGPARAHLLRLFCRGLRRIERHFVTAGWAPSATHWSRLERLAPLHSIAACDSSHDALLTFTSGSTGVPKAAVRSHGFLLAQHDALAAAIDLEPGEVDLATLPIFVLANLASGVTTVIPQGDLRRSGFIEPGPVLGQIERLASRNRRLAGAVRAVLQGARAGGGREGCARHPWGRSELYRWVLPSSLPSAAAQSACGKVESSWSNG